MSRFAFILGLAIVMPLSAAEAPTPRDFAWRQPLAVEAGLPIQELPVPDAVYMHVLHADLSDLRVFDASGGVVPHTICAAPAVKQTEPALETLEPLPLVGGAKPVIGEGGRIEFTTTGGTHVSIHEQGGIASPVRPQAASPDRSAIPPTDRIIAYVVDLRADARHARAITLDWQSADQASEATVSLKSSEDLSQWQTLMTSATLLQAQSGSQSLQRSRIPLAESGYRFLRIEAGASGPLPLIKSVSVERATAPETLPPTWIEAQAMPAEPKDPAVAFVFSAERRAPMHSAEVRLPAANMALGVLLQSRDDPDHAWRRRWQGGVFALSSESQTRGQTVVQFEPTADRYWRLEIQRGAETLRGMSPSLLLGYRPARLRFLAQGEDPFQLAYGSARVERQQPGCESLLAGLKPDERRSMSGRAEAAGTPMRSNLEALKPPPEPTPLRQMLLWGVLIAGALLVAAMALSLLKKLRQE